MNAMTRKLCLFGLMAVTASVTWALTPRQKMADEQEPIRLEAMVPRQFGDWTEVPGTPTLLVDPGQAALIGQIYSETLSRVYVNRENYSIMLSVAYGRDQRDGLQMHQPEVCYPAQGFSIVESRPHTLQLDGLQLPARQVQAQGPRPEPLTYWSVVGTHAHQGGVAKKLTEMRYGLSGKIPDGMLVRVSSVDGRTDKAYAMQAQFAAQFAAALPASVRSRFVGDGVQ